MLSKKKLLGGYPNTSYDIPALLELINKLNHRDILNNLIIYLTSLRNKIIQKKDEQEIKLKDDLEIDINGKNKYLENINKKFEECKMKYDDDVRRSTLADRMSEKDVNIPEQCKLLYEYKTIDNRNFIDNYISSNKQNNILEHKISQYTQIIDELREILNKQSGRGHKESLDEETIKRYKILLQNDEIQQILQYDEIQQILKEYNDLETILKKTDDEIEFLEKELAITKLGPKFKECRDKIKKLKSTKSEISTKIINLNTIIQTNYNFKLGIKILFNLNLFQESQSLQESQLTQESQSLQELQLPQALDNKTEFTYVQEYISRIKQFCFSNEITPPLQILIREILEYLYMIFSNKLLVNNKIVGIPPLNIIITGTPGIGKSYIAGQISKFLSLTMLLPIGKLNMIKKPDVIGQYVGQTAPRAYEKLLSNIGNICFIDEAYSFAGEKRVGHGFDPFGKEFIDALVDFASEYTGLISIIAAGYKKEMTEQFINVNDGIDRRFPIKINITRYDLQTFIDLFHKNSNLDQLCSELSFNTENTSKINNYLMQLISFCYIQFSSCVHTFNINDKIYVIPVYDDSITERILVAYLLSKCNIKHGDLFINQFSDLLKFIDIIKTVLVINPEENLYSKFKQIATTYIKTKTDKQFELHIGDYEIFGKYLFCVYNPLFNIDEINEFNSILEMFSSASLLPISQLLGENTYTFNNLTKSIPVYSKTYKTYIIKICYYFLKSIDNSSDFILFTKEELEEVIRKFII